MTTAKTTLSSQQWELLFLLPADGQPHHVEGVAFRAWHHPATRLKVEQVVAETQYGTLRRRKVSGRWQATDYIQSH